MSIEENVPGHWALAATSEIASEEDYSLAIGPFGSSLKVSDYTDAGVPLIFVRNIRAESFGLEGGKFVSSTKAAELRAHWAMPGDVLITKMGAPPGDSALYNAQVHFGVITADCIKWRIAPSLGIPKFFVYATRSPLVQSQIRAITSGVAQMKVSLERFRGVRYPIAPPPEQQRIVDAIESYFTRLDDAVATLERVERNLKRYRASVLKSAVEGRLVPTEGALAKEEGRDYEPASVLLERILTERRRRWSESGKKGKYQEPTPPNAANLPALPEGWCWANLDQLAPLIRNGQSKAPTASGSVPILRISAVRPMAIDFDDIRYLSGNIDEYADDLIEVGDLLFTRYNGSPSLVGACGCVRQLVRSTAHPDKLIKVRLHPQLLPEFVELAANTGESRRHIASRIRTTAGQAGVSGADLRQMPVPLPPLSEQKRIADEVERLWSLSKDALRTASANRVRAGRLRQAILKWAFEGQLADQDPNNEPASTLLERIKAAREANTTDRPPRPRSITKKQVRA